MKCSIRVLRRGPQRQTPGAEGEIGQSTFSELSEGLPAAHRTNCQSDGGFCELHLTGLPARSPFSDSELEAISMQPLKITRPVEWSRPSIRGRIRLLALFARHPLIVHITPNREIQFPRRPRFRPPRSVYRVLALNLT